MVTLLVLFQLFIVLALIFIGARVGGIGRGIYGMVGVFILVFIFGTHPGKVPCASIRHTLLITVR